MLGRKNKNDPLVSLAFESPVSDSELTNLNQPAYGDLPLTPRLSQLLFPLFLLIPPVLNRVVQERKNQY